MQKQKQKVINQKGEIEFRRKLYSQQVEGKNLFDDEYDSQGIEAILKDRMVRTIDQMNSLKEKGIPLSPYIEIGAERVQRSLVMENDINAMGAAIDISFDMLKSGSHYQKVFGMKKTPIRICCDANLLPFKSSSFPFIFCYETLHHFPDPSFIVEEINRVLTPGGFFYFEEEPYKQVLHVNLYKGKRIYSKQTLNKSKFKRIIDRFLKTPSCNEVDHNIIENHQIPIKGWKKVLSVFDEKRITLRTVASIEIDLYKAYSLMKYIIAYLLGGSISGLCKKDGSAQNLPSPINSSLICPTCITRLNTEFVLVPHENCFKCPDCSSQYPIIDNVLFLFKEEKFAELYPEFVDLK